MDDFTNRKDTSKYFSAVDSKTKNIYSSTYDFLVNCEDMEVKLRVKRPNSKYFNAGVFVTDLQRWRQDGVTHQLEYWLSLNTQRKLWNWGSQAPLALVFYDKWISVDPSWNERRMQYHNREEFEFLVPNVRVYHFAGNTKPWKSNGKMMWHIWCKYYPKRSEYWFCQEGNEMNLLPASPLDYRFVRNFWQSPQF